MGLFSRSSPDLETVREAIENQARRVSEILRTIDEVNSETKRRFRELEENIQAHEKAVRLMAEEMEERIDRGNKIWRKIRASEYYASQRQESDEDEDPNFELHFGNGAGSQEETMPAVHPGLGWPRRPTTKAQEVGKALARRIAGISD